MMKLKHLHKYNCCYHFFLIHCIKKAHGLKQRKRRKVQGKLIIKGGDDFIVNHKSYNFLACDWFKNVLFSTNSLAKLLSDSLLLDSLLLDSLLSDSLISQSHSKM